MNEILKKRIEKESNTEMLRYYDDDEYLCGIKDIQGDFKEAFKKGAEYALSHQWISVDEALPEANVRARMRDISHWMPIPKF